MLTKKAEERIKELGYFDDCGYTTAEIRVYDLNKDYCFNCAKKFYTFESE